MRMQAATRYLNRLLAPGYRLSTVSNFSLRLASLVGKLALSVYMARFMGLSDVGIYGLAFGCVMIAVTFFGLRLDYIVSREISVYDPDAAASAFRATTLFYLASFMACAVPAMVALGSPKLGLSLGGQAVIYGLCCLEAYANLLYVVTIALDRSVLANALFFVRSGFWTIPAVVLSWCFPDLRNAMFVLQCWAVGSAASIVLSLWLLRGRLLRRVHRSYKLWTWLSPALKRVLMVWIGSVALSFGAYLDRFILAHYLTLDKVGVATIYLSFTSAALTLVQCSTLAVRFPKLIDLFETGQIESYNAEYRRLWWLANVLAVGIVIALGVAIPAFASLAHKPAIADNAPAFALLLLAIWIRSLAECTYYRLFIERKHGAIWGGSLMFFVASGTLNVLLIPHYGIAGLGLASVLASAALLAWRAWFARRPHAELAEIPGLPMVMTDSETGIVPSPSRHVLILSRRYALAYRGLRCLHAAGLQVSVLGTRNTRAVGASRFIHRFIRADDDLFTADPDIFVEKVNEVIARLGVDIVAASDTTSLPLLIANADRLNARCFPSPTPAQFDILNSKAAFRAKCQAEDVPVPAGFVCHDASHIKSEIEARQLRWPLIFKPVDSDGSKGIFKVDRQNLAEKIEEIFYSPIVVEEFIAGTDVGITVFCDDGEIKASICHALEEKVYKVIEFPAMRAAVAKLMRGMKCSGVYNFDARLTAEGSVFLLECNPRFCYTMCLSLLAGVNLPELGTRIQPAAIDEPRAGSVAYSSTAILFEVLKRRRVSRKLARDAKFWISDPLLFTYEVLKVSKELRSDTKGYLDFLVTRFRTYVLGRRSATGRGDEDGHRSYGIGPAMRPFALGFLALAVIIGGIGWLVHQGKDDVLVAESDVIAAPSQTYKEKPKNPGGKTFERTGDTSFAISEGQARPVRLGDADMAKPAPDAGAKSAAAVAADTSGVGVQVAAYSSQAHAEAGWTKLSGQYPNLAGMRHRVVEGSADIGTVYRLVAVTTDANAAQALCAGLKAAGLACQVKN